MASKVNVRAIVADHIDTLRDARTHRLSLGDIFVQFGVPVCIGAIVPSFGIRLAEVGQLIEGLAVLAGFTFGLLVFVFQLRLHVASDPRVVGTNLRELIDQLFTNVAYAVLVGLVCVTLAVVFVSVQRDPAPPSGASSVLGSISTGVMIAAASHFLLTLAMCTKRAYRAYQRVT